MQHATFDTAKRLKEAGFPQPSPEFGQVWWHPESETNAVLINSDRSDGRCLFMDAEGFRLFMKLEDLIFAPTDADILLQMPDGHALTRVNQDMFICIEGEPLMGTDGCEYDVAEAAAIDWFEWKGIETRRERFQRLYLKATAK